MLVPRIIPCLLIHNNGLVKTVLFKNPKYVGDPINAVRIFNEKEVDELIVLDIDATIKNQKPDYKRIEDLAAECRMPLCYGGGIRTVEQAHQVFSLGVEKIAISYIAIERPEIISEIADRVGRQSVVVVLDIRKRRFGGYEVYTHNGTRNAGIDPVQFAVKAEALGAGEVVVNSIDRDGLMNGYDLKLLERIRSKISVPMTVLGGAGKLQDMGDLMRQFGMIGAAAGSLFVFKGVYKAVLINYPNKNEKETLIARNFSPIGEVNTSK